MQRAALICLCGIAPLASGACEDHFASGHIPSAKGTFLCRKKGRENFYATVYDTSLKCPVFSAFHILAAQQKKDHYARKGFILDPDVDADEQAHHDSKAFDGRDIGHLAPSEAFSWDQSDGGPWALTYIMTNVAPQGSYFNEHPWAKIEGHVVDWAANTGRNAYVITGVIQRSGDSGPMMIDGVAVPTHFYKAVCDLDAGTSFVSIGTNELHCKECGMPNMQPVKKVTDMLGYTLFPTECKTSTVDPDHWGWSSFVEKVASLSNVTARFII